MTGIRDGVPIYLSDKEGLNLEYRQGNGDNWNPILQNVPVFLILRKNTNININDIQIRRIEEDNGIFHFYTKKQEDENSTDAKKKNLQFDDCVKATWKVNNDNDKKWILAWKKDPNLNPDESFLMEFKKDHKLKIRIQYNMPPNCKTHILCKKIQGKTMHALGPIDDRDICYVKDTDSSVQYIKKNYLVATIPMNESETIRCVGVENAQMVPTEVILIGDYRKAEFRIGRSDLIWEITFIRILPPKNGSTQIISNLSIRVDTDVSVTMGEGKPGTGIF